MKEQIKNTADKQYQDLLSNILKNGRVKMDRTTTGTISIPYATLDFDMKDGFPLLTTKKVFTKGIIHELLWFLKGDTNIQYLVNNGVNIWTPDAYREYKKLFIPFGDEKPATIEEFSESVKIKGWDLGPVYGGQWRRWQTNRKHLVSPDEFDDYILIDQVKDAMDKLINNPDDRRIIVSAWNVGEIDKMALPPCHYMFQLYSEELTNDEILEYYYKNIKPEAIWKKDEAGEYFYYDKETNMWFQHSTSDIIFGMKPNCPKRRLSLIWDQRSCDTFLGIPFNIASYGILLHMFAQQANMVPGQLIGSLKNVHIYNNHKEQCLEQISREPRALPKLVLNKAKDIFSYTYDDIKFVNYNPHEAIKGEISV